MKKIPKEFRKNGFDYKLLKRTPTVAMYEQFDGKGRLIGFGVHIVRVRKPRHTKFKQSDGTYKHFEMPLRESLASNEDFGTYGWYCESKENALNKFNQININTENGLGVQ